MDRWVGKVAIVTGASSGIGAALTEALVREGVIILYLSGKPDAYHQIRRPKSPYEGAHRHGALIGVRGAAQYLVNHLYGGLLRGYEVAGFARRQERVESLAAKLEGSKGKLYAVHVDVSKEESIQKGFEWVTENLGAIHILVNNAGVAPEGSIINGEIDNWRKTFDTNLLGLAICTTKAIQNMNENNVAGHIINIGSILGHYNLGITFASIYTAAKHGVTAFAEALRLELVKAKSKIKITNVSPGVVVTEMTPPDYPPITELLENNIYLRSEDIANGIIYVLSTPPHVQVHEIMIRAVGENLY